MKETKAITQWKVPMVPDKKALEKRSAPLLKQSKGYEIKSEDHFLASWSLVLRHDRAIAKIEELFDPFISGLHRLHKMAIAMRDEFLKPIVASKKNLLAKRMLYRGLAEAAQKKKDEEAAKLLQAQQKKDLEKQAKAAERQGDRETAELLREQKEITPLHFFSSAPAVPKQQGSVITKRWVFEIIDPAAVEREYCSPDPKLIRPVVEALGPLCNISGLQISEEKSEHSRAVSA